MERLLKEKALSLRSRIIGWRRDIHRHPELELNCHRTAAIVSKELQALGLEVKTGIAGTGVTGTLYGSEPGPVVALRVDMDALPVTEQTGLPFASEVEGAMHACGHDGHTALGLGTAAVLSRVREHLRGTVRFIFQPGEESPGGAGLMIAEGVLENPRVEALFGCHIFPGVASGSIGVRYGVMTARNDEFIITLAGVGGHGAYPHKCTDVIVAAGHLIVGIQTIVSRSNDPVTPLVVTVAQICGGTGHNVMPESVTLKGTVRSIDESSREIAFRRLKDLLKGISTAFDVQGDLEIVAGGPCLKCDERITGFVEKKLVGLIGKERVDIITRPSLGAEDFALFSEAVPSSYIRIGSYSEEKGFIHNLHTPRFDFDEQILVDGAYILSCLLYEYLLSAHGGPHV